MKAKYIIRLDDICPTMNWTNFNKLENIFNKYNIKPIIGVIPSNKDKKLIVGPPKTKYWEKIKLLSDKGWIIAQHGYEHCYTTKESGLLKLNNYSEFAGVSYAEQYEKIKKGKEILEQELSIKIEWWMAPAHSFDRNTCRVLKNLGYKYITDGIAIYPFNRYGLTWVPQQIWEPVDKQFGMWTICLHPNTITDTVLQNVLEFVQSNKDCIKNDFTVSSSTAIVNLIYKRFWYLIIFLQRIKKRYL